MDHENFLSRAAAFEPIFAPMVPAQACGEGEALLENRFTFDGETHALGPVVDWNANPGGAHWLHDLNRFGFLNVLAPAGAFSNAFPLAHAEKALALMLDWAASNPAAAATRADGAVWSPGAWGNLPNIVIRLENWSLALARIARAYPEMLTPARIAAIAASVKEQAAIAEQAAQSRADNWLAIASRALLVCAELFEDARTPAARVYHAFLQSLPRQTAPDGVSVELTPHYHWVVAECLAASLASGERLALPSCADAPRTLAAMVYALRQMMTPDGRIAAFNDADPEYAPRVLAFLNHPALKRLAPEALARPLATHFFTHAGWAVFRHADDLYLAFDAGPFGAVHQHEDKLSFVLSAYGRAFIVDPGRHRYDLSERSLWAYLQSTAAHSTIRIDGCDQASRAAPETWRPDRPAAALFTQTARAVAAESAYELGYGPQRIPVRHTRRITFFPQDGYWLLEDRLEGEGTHEIEAAFQFAPAALTCGPGFAHTNFHDANLIIAYEPHVWTQARIACGETSPSRAWWAPRLGEAAPAPMLLLRARQQLPASSRLILYPLRGPVSEAARAHAMRLGAQHDISPHPSSAPR
ncbi:MAG: alginate lyase family protein [Hyphomonadaceae bacterium]